MPKSDKLLGHQLITPGKVVKSKGSRERGYVQGGPLFVLLPRLQPGRWALPESLDGKFGFLERGGAAKGKIDGEGAALAWNRGNFNPSVMGLGQ